MVTIKILPIEEIPKTRRGKMFLILLVLTVISLIVMLHHPSLLTGIAFAVILGVTLIDILIYGKELDKRTRVIEMLREFISPLISALEAKIHEIDRYLSGDKQFSLTLLRPNYKYVHKDILSDKNYDKIKEKVEEYNKLVRAERLEEAKRVAKELNDKLEELKNKHSEENGIAGKEIEKKDHTPFVIQRRRR